MALDSDWITRYRGATTSWLSALNQLLALRQQYDALDYGATLTPEDFAPPNDDITLAQLTAAVSSVEAIDGFVHTGHATNLYALVL